MMLDARKVHPATWIVAGCSCLLVSLSPLKLGEQVGFLILLASLFFLYGLGRRYTVFALVGMVPVALIALTIQTMSYQHNQTLWASFSPLPGMTFALGPQGLAWGLHLALQILLFGSSCALLALPQTPEALRAALHRWRVPSRITYLLVASLNAPTQLRRSLGLVRESQQMRGLAEGGLLGNLRLLAYTLLALTNLILVENEGRTLTLQQRGLDAPTRTLLRTYPDTGLQRLVRYLLAATGLLLTFLTYWR